MLTASPPLEIPSSPELSDPPLGSPVRGLGRLTGSLVPWADGCLVTSSPTTTGGEKGLGGKASVVIPEPAAAKRGGE